MYRGAGLGLLLFGCACLPADEAGTPPVVAVAHEQYPDFEQFSDTLPPVLSGTGARAQWSGDEGSQGGEDLTHSASTDSRHLSSDSAGGSQSAGAVASYQR